MGGRAAAGIAAAFGGGKGRIDLDAIPDLSMTRGGWHWQGFDAPPVQQAQGKLGGT